MYVLALVLTSLLFPKVERLDLIIIFLLQLVYDDTGRDITTFLHLDRGAVPVDHHCFFFFEGPKSHVHHSSFETVDFDTQVLGHDWLRDKGYENCWGVGRHIMGSQIFDYWSVILEGNLQEWFAHHILGSTRRALSWSITSMATLWIQATLRTEARLRRTTSTSGVCIAYPTTSACGGFRIPSPLTLLFFAGPDLPPTFLQ